ncbi:hypothetical protein F5Y04DRAFT_277097 [Hypomontagnella monticulosa]|nr:hypothetical protein F5Y04DRAFT_277097 [Hypomontagnella monticulosa]
MDHYAVDRVGSAQDMEAHVMLPRIQMRVAASMWKNLDNRMKAGILETSRMATGGQRVHFILNRMHPDEVIVANLRDIVFDERFTLDACLYEGIPILGLSLSSNPNSTLPPSSTPMVPQPMRPTSTAPATSGAYQVRQQASQPQAYLPQAQPQQQQAIVPQAQRQATIHQVQTNGYQMPGQLDVAGRPSVQRPEPTVSNKRAHSVIEDDGEQIDPFVDDEPNAAVGASGAARRPSRKTRKSRSNATADSSSTESKSYGPPAD